MKTKVIIVFFVLLFGCETKKADISLVKYGKESNYQLEYESGYVFTQDNVSYIVLRFYKPSEWFVTDTGERFHVYVKVSKFSANEEGMTIQRVEPFFIRVQMYGSYGFLKAEEWESQVDDGSAYITAKLSGKTILSQGKPPAESTQVGISFRNLFLRKALSKNDLMKKDNDYIKSKFNQYFDRYWQKSQ